MAVTHEAVKPYKISAIFDEDYCMGGCNLPQFTLTGVPELRLYFEDCRSRW